MTELHIDISGNKLTIREESTVLYTVSAAKIIVHSKKFPTIIDQDGRDWSKDIREAPESERPEYTMTFISEKPSRTIDLFLQDNYAIVQEGQIVRFQMKYDSCQMHCDREGIYEDGWDPLVEAIEYTLHKKGRYQYIEKYHVYRFWFNTDTIRIDLDTGDRVNIDELERVLQSRKNPQPKKKEPSTAAGCCGCAVILFILCILLGLLGR